ncbi:MAG: hypothetical protein EA381_07405 [Planctomycetaceae bacterium]|nr:MAG: hypothetical protein EA381_07405 [Planctomycetaceae bacterium]
MTPERDDMEIQASPTGSPFAGCLASLGWTVVACLVLFINGGLALALTRSWEDQAGPWLRDDRVVQMIVLLGPVVMLVFQWWLFDQLRDRFWFRRSPS